MYKAADPLNARLAEYAYTIIRNDILAGRFGPTRVWEYYRLNRAFHLRMAAAAANKALMSALESLWDQATNFQMFTMYSTEELRRLVAPHELLVDVAEREDAAEIERAVSQ